MESNRTDAEFLRKSDAEHVSRFKLREDCGGCIIEGREISSVTRELARLEAELAAAKAQLPPQHWNAVYNTDALNRACAELPEGWEIKIGLEKDAGWIDLYTPTGEQIDLVNAADTIYWMVHAAIDHARQAEAQGEKK
jgi:hypothetical protein